MLPYLDQELSRLPDKYRVPIVLCELEGWSRKETATHLRIPEGTLSSRLAYAKKLLAKRLSRHGMLLPAGGLAAVLSPSALRACVSSALLSSTAKAALGMGTQGPLAAGLVSAQVLTLTEGVMKAMLLSKLKAFGSVALGLLIGAGALGLTYGAASAQAQKPRESTRATRMADELEELRLEVAAMRKGMEVMRGRIDSLESEVQKLRTNPPIVMHGGGMGMLGGGLGGLNSGGALGLTGGGLSGGFSGMSAGGGTAAPKNFPPAEALARPKKPADPLADAEAALDKLRANPSDKQAADALDRAVKMLRERSSPKKDDSLRR